MCEVILVRLQCVTVHLLPIMSNNSEVNNYFFIINVHTKYFKAVIF